MSLPKPSIGPRPDVSFAFSRSLTRKFERHHHVDHKTYNQWIYHSFRPDTFRIHHERHSGACRGNPGSGRTGADFDQIRLEITATRCASHPSRSKGTKTVSSLYSLYKRPTIASFPSRSKDWKTANSFSQRSPITSQLSSGRFPIVSSNRRNNFTTLIA